MEASNQRPASKKRQSGQGTIELIVSLFAFITVLFMVVQLSLGFAVANYIQYVTYMASRAFLAGYLDPADQRAAANSYLTRMLQGQGGSDRFGTIAKGEGGSGDITGVTVGSSSRVSIAGNTARDTAWEQGVTYAFRIKMYLAPLIPGVHSGNDSTVLLESQSWLGREPTEKDCETVLSSRRQKSQVNNQMLYDNGC